MLLPEFITTSSAEKLHYCAQDALPLSAMDEEKIMQVVSDLVGADDAKAHNVTGWMGCNRVVVSRNYQNKRGITNGVILTREQRYRLSLQVITFPVPKLLRWLPTRRNLIVVAYNSRATADQPASGLQELRHLSDEKLTAQLNADWQQLNDYFGLACWQMAHDMPLWQAVQDRVTPELITAYCHAEVFSRPHLQKNEDAEGFWIENFFFARNLTPQPTLEISWRVEGQGKESISTYRFSAADTDKVSFRPYKDEDFYPLSGWDVVHLEQILSWWQQLPQILPLAMK